MFIYFYKFIIKLYQKILAKSKYLTKIVTFSRFNELI